MCPNIVSRYTQTIVHTDTHIESLTDVIIYSIAVSGVFVPVSLFFSSSYSLPVLQQLNAT